MIGIKGMGGGGKTTLARAVFDNISISFEGKSFVDNVRKGLKSSGLKELQKQVLKNVLNDQNIDVTSVYDGKNKMKRMMGSRKVLVVLDDVDDIDKLEALAGEPRWFKRGSRIIITTRDKQVLVAHRVNFIHDVNLLSNEEAICLFNKYAFGREIPNGGYEELSRKVAHYVASLPLTLKVLGSHLCGRNEHEWVDAIERLKIIPLEKTLKRLELSYDGLEDDQKEIFLDVVCILKGKSEDYAIKTLESCGFKAKIGLSILEQKSLITISNTDGLRFHDHIEEMGWNIIRRLHPHGPNRHSRLWFQEEIEDILVNDLGTEETKCIKLEYANLHFATIMKGLGNMKELRFLHVENGSKIVDGVCEYLPNALRTLYWWGYPFCCLPKTFQANKLVSLEMPMSSISQLWEARERKVLNKLKFLELCYSKVTNLNLGMTPHLEKLNLQGCNEFVELQLPVKCPNLKFLNLSCSKVSNLNLGMTPRIENLNLEVCNEFVELHLPVECPNLRILNMRGSKLRNLNLGMTPHLEELDLGGCNEFVELHLPIKCPNLRILNLHGSKLRNLNHGMTPRLEKLDLQGCIEFLELHLPVECPNLEYLNLGGSKVSNLNLEMTPHLVQLVLKGCYFLKEVYAPLGCLKELVYLNLSGCLRFKHFLVDKGHESTKSIAKLELNVESVNICPLHPSSNLPKFQITCIYVEHLPSSSGNLEKLISFGLCTCTDLESFSTTICSLQHLRGLTLKGSIPEVPKDLWQLDILEELTLSMEEINHLPDSICMLKHLKYIYLRSCWHLKELPKDLGRLEGLYVLDLANCMSLRDIPSSICNIKCLKRFILSDCMLVEKLPEELECLECLEVLNIEGMRISHLPQNILQLKGLCIIGCRWQLESYGFTSLTEIPSVLRPVASCFVYL